MTKNLVLAALLSSVAAFSYAQTPSTAAPAGAAPVATTTTAAAPKPEMKAGKKAGKKHGKKAAPKAAMATK